MILEILVVEPLMNNAYLIADEKSRDAVVVDPAMGAQAILEKLSGVKARLRYILNTHGHYDHIADNSPLREATAAKIAIHREDAHRLEEDASEALRYMPIIPPASKADILLAEGAMIEVGSLVLKALHTPGHTEGSSCFYLEEEGLLFTGDTLFAGTCGRTDLRGGDPLRMVESLARLSTLPLRVKVYPGHGLPTTIGAEGWIARPSTVKSLLGLV